VESRAGTLNDQPLDAARDSTASRGGGMKMGQGAVACPEKIQLAGCPS
jgi:hypothetical protein